MVTQIIHDRRSAVRSLETDYGQHVYKVFRLYYRIGGGNEQDAADDEPERERKRQEELKKGHTEPSHSLYGLVGQIATQTGWSIHYILNRVNVVSLQLMMQDIPHWVPPEKKNIIQQIQEMEKRRKKNPEKEQKGMSPLDYFTNFAIKD